MNAARKRHRTLRSKIYYLLCILLLTGCAVRGSAAQALPMSPNAPVYAYLIINGVAQGAMMRGKLSPSSSEKLIKIDKETRKILMQNVRQHSMRHDYQASVALEYFLSSITR